MSSFNGGRKQLLIWSMGGVLLLLSAFAVGESSVVPGSKAAMLDVCVAPTADIRRNHMDYLKHERDETVRNGIRDRKFSLSECVDCHAGKDDDNHPIAVNAEGQFCQGCHEYVAVSIPCFQCHRKTPEADSKQLSVYDPVLHSKKHLGIGLNPVLKDAKPLVSQEN